LKASNILTKKIWRDEKEFLDKKQSMKRWDLPLNRKWHPWNSRRWDLVVMIKWTRKAIIQRLRFLC